MVVFYYNKTTYLMVVVAGAAAMVPVTADAAEGGSAVLAGVPAGVPLFVGDPFYMWHIGFTIYLNK